MARESASTIPSKERDKADTTAPSARRASPGTGNRPSRSRLRFFRLSILAAIYKRLLRTRTEEDFGSGERVAQTEYRE